MFKSKIWILAALIVAGLVLSACKNESVLSEQYGMEISDMRIKPPLKGRNVTAAYFDVSNVTDTDDALIGATSPIAERIEMHLSAEVDGVMTMRRQVSIALPAGLKQEFKPGGYHLMLFGTQLEEGQTEAPITLKFKHASDLTIIAEISEMAQQNGHGSHH